MGPVKSTLKEKSIISIISLVIDKSITRANAKAY